MGTKKYTVLAGLMCMALAACSTTDSGTAMSGESYGSSTTAGAADSSGASSGSAYGSGSASGATSSGTSDTSQSPAMSMQGVVQSIEAVPRAQAGTMDTWSSGSQSGSASSGASGTTGGTASSGASGSMGSSASMGSAGASGSMGASGASGSMGSSGASGSSGTAGSSSADVAYRITLRMDDGTTRVMTQASPPSFQIGDRVRMSNGMLQRY